MKLKHLSLAALVSSAATAQTLPDLNSILSNTTQVSNLTDILKGNPALVESLSSAKDITILAPNNDAFAKLLSNPDVAALAADPDFISALLTYHVLNGTYSASDLTNTSAFVPTLLTDEAYANVTGGQVVEGVKVGDDVLFFSGLLQNSTVVQAVRIQSIQPISQTHL